MRRPGDLLVVLADGSSPTRPSQAARPSWTPAAPTRQRRRRLLLAFAGLVILLFAVGLLLAFSERLGGFMPPAHTAASALLGATATQTGLARTQVAAAGAATSEAAVRPVAVVAAEMPTPTATATDIPAPTATEPEAASATPTSIGADLAVTEGTPPDGAYVQLAYDAQTLVVYNPTDRTIDLSDLQFVQAVEGGNALSFRSSFWSDTGLLKPNACFQVWIDRYLDWEMPDYCAERESWRSVSFVRWFWLSENASATFDVRRGDQVLARCPIFSGECIVRLPDENIG